MTDKNESNRRRKWAPKARTGCRTCKTRHVKCDEAKPTCRRCVLSGFRCDGYPSIPSKHSNEDSPPLEERIDTKESQPDIDTNSIPAIEPKAEPNSPESKQLTTVPILQSLSEPYVQGERHSLKYFIDTTAAMVARSTIGPTFWQTLVPQAAWNYPSVRHAMLAASISSESLINRDSVTGNRASSEVKVLTHTSKAVQALLSERVPMDVVLLTSATLGILDLFNGQWSTACTHVTSGAKMAREARSDPTSDSFISFYCEAFATALPSILKNAEGVADKYPPEKSSLVRLNEAVHSLRRAKESLDLAIPKVETSKVSDRDRILKVLRIAHQETLWILKRWEALLMEERSRTSPPDEKLALDIHSVESPWSAIVDDLNAHLDHGTAFDVARFEVAMERTLPFYTLAKSGPNVKMREVAAELMYWGAQMRRRTPATPSPIAYTSGHVYDIDDDAG